MGSKGNKVRFTVNHEDEEILWVCKEAGLVVQGASAQDQKDSLPDLLRKKRKNLAFLAPVNRLDRNVSGIVMFAKNPKAAHKFQQLLKNRKITKTYTGFVLGDPGRQGLLKHFIRKDPSTQKAQIRAELPKENPAPHFKLAELNFLRKESFPLGGITCSKLEIELITGRYHQIRAQFSFMGHPLLGDPKYGTPLARKIFYRPALHAQSLSHEKRYECPLPLELLELEKQLRNQSLERSL
jgi:23S rRNA pseudouridine1911/1915/1917 synthase